MFEVLKFLQVGELPCLLLAANAVMRIPATSSKHSCAPGWGRSLRTMTRMPVGQQAGSMRPVSSATQAPS